MNQKQKGGFLSMLLGTLDANLLENMLAGKGVMRAGERIIRASYGSKGSSLKIFDLKKILILLHPLTNFEIQKYYQNEPRFNRVYSRDNVPNKIKTRSICNKS